MNYLSNQNSKYQIESIVTKILGEQMETWDINGGSIQIPTKQTTEISLGDIVRELQTHWSHIKIYPYHKGFDISFSNDESLIFSKSKNYSQFQVRTLSQTYVIRNSHF